MPSRESRRSHAGLLVDNDRSDGGMAPGRDQKHGHYSPLRVSYLDGLLADDDPVQDLPWERFFRPLILGFLDDIETRGTDQVSYVC